MLAERIRNLRNELRMSQYTLAEKAHVSQQSVHKWETGVAEPKSSALNNLANILNTSTDYLLGRTNDRYDLSPFEKEDVGKQAENILKGLNSDATVNFYGEPMTDEDRIQLRTALEIGLTSNKMRAKKAKSEE